MGPPAFTPVLKSRLGARVKVVPSHHIANGKASPLLSFDGEASKFHGCEPAA